MTATAAAIDRLLPQTQCRECGYDGCLPYAQAVATGEAYNLCARAEKPSFGTFPPCSANPLSHLPKPKPKHSPG